MQENKGKMSWKVFWLFFINPLTAAVYLVFLQRLYRLCQFGGKRRNIPILVVKSKSKRATVYLDGSVSDQEKDSKKLQPMLEILKQVNLEDAVQQWGEEEYGIIYYGVRDWGNDSTGIIRVKLNENSQSNAETGSDIRGYTVSVFVPGKENEITPIRYLAAAEGEDQSCSETLEEDKPAVINPDEEFQFEHGGRFRLNVVDAALGSRYYALEYSDDGGKSWLVENQDPFLGRAGVAAGITFINDKLGFFCLFHNGGDEAELFRTDDGGKTTEPVQLPYSVMEKEPNQDSPFDFPQMPYEEDGILKMVIGQGADGAQEVLYQSEDGGISWEFVKEIR